MANKHTYANRLIKLAQFLEKLPNKRFNYEKWVGPDWEGKQNLSCGTTACAMGWAATMPLFRRLGLHLFDDAGMGVVALRSGDGGILIGVSACAAIFGIDQQEAEYLFIPSSDRAEQKLDEKCAMGPKSDASAKEVAKHIRRFTRYKFKGFSALKDLPTP